MAEHTSLHPSTQRLRAIVVTPRDADAPFLLVEIEIDCQVCGGFTVTIAGHHVRALSEALADVVAENPDLCGRGIAQARRERLEWQGSGKETLN